MKVYTVNGHDYRLPGGLNDFQRQMYVHLINWKWQHLTREPGMDIKGNVYDAWLPPAFVAEYRILYPPIGDAVHRHKAKYPFREHSYFHHMASSQAANFNLFLPILLHPRAADVLRQVKLDFARLATEELDHGFRVEFKDKPPTVAGDTPVIANADADIAIAYYNEAGELCLWLIEHKLTEKEFTTCGGYAAAKGSPTHDCSKSLAEIIAAPELCYYTYPCCYRYWAATQQHTSFFAHPAPCSGCPFRGGMNQLWRNQLLASSVEGSQAWAPYKHAFFSVVVHPDNHALDNTIATYKSLIADDPDPARRRFSTLTSAAFVRAAAALNDRELNRWVDWYSGLYYVAPE